MLYLFFVRYSPKAFTVSSICSSSFKISLFLSNKLHLLSYAFASSEKARSRRVL